MVEIQTDVEAQKTVRDCACSACWGHLVLFPADPPPGVEAKAGEHFARALCGVCGEATRGYVSKRYVERKLAESRAEAFEVRQALKGAIPSLATRVTAQEALSDLGY